MQNCHNLNRVYSQTAFAQNTQEAHNGMVYAESSEQQG